MVFLLLCLIATFGGAQACTSFASTLGEPIYGTNFDWSQDPEIFFKIVTTPKGRYLVMSFQSAYGQVDMLGMNDRGLLATLQAVPPRQISIPRGQATIDIHQVFTRALISADTVGDVERIIGSNRVIPVPGFSLQAFFADPGGDGLILEVGERENHLIPGHGALAMSNFYLSDFPDQDYRSMVGPGDWRYRAAMRQVLESGEKMDLSEGLATLEMVSQVGTRASLVFFPFEQVIYLTLARDYTRVWRIDLTSGVIQTEQGFAQDRSKDLGGGVRSSHLLTWI